MSGRPACDPAKIADVLQQGLGQAANVSLAPRPAAPPFVQGRDPTDLVLRRALERVKNDRPSPADPARGALRIVFVVLPNKDAATYKVVKQVEQEVGVTTQCMQGTPHFAEISQQGLRARGMLQYLANIALKARRRCDFIDAAIVTTVRQVLLAGHGS